MNELLLVGDRNEAVPLPSFSVIPARQVQSSKLSRFHMCLSPSGLASPKRSKVQPRSSDRSPALYWPRVQAKHPGSPLVFSLHILLAHKDKALFKLLSFPCFPFLLFQTEAVLCEGRGGFFFFLHKYLIFSNLPFCTICQLQTALFALVGNRILF